MKTYLNILLPLEAQYLYRRGLEMRDQQKEDIALGYFRKAVIIAPGFSKAYREMANCLASLGHNAEAAVYNSKAARIEPPYKAAIAGVAMN